MEANPKGGIKIKLYGVPQMNTYRAWVFIGQIAPHQLIWFGVLLHDNENT